MVWYNLAMFYGRLLTFFYAMLLVFSQQQVLLHPYVHQADWPALAQSSNTSLNPNTAQAPQLSALPYVVEADSYSDKQAPNHAPSCGQCLALAGIAGFIATQSFVFHATLSQFQPTSLAVNSFASTHCQPYQSRAPPRFYNS